MSSYHYSDLRAFTTCPKMFWQRFQVERPAHFSFTQMQMSLKDALIQKLNLEDYVMGVRGMETSLSLEYLKTNEWVLNARFEYAGLRVKVPAIHVLEDGLEVYFTSLSTHPKIEDRTYYASIIYVLENNNLNINQVNVMYFNKNYVRDESLDIHACFDLSSRFLKISGYDQGDILESCHKKNINIDENIKQMLVIEEMETFDYELEDCPLGQRCSFFKQCFPEFKEEPLSISKKLIDRYENPEKYSTPLSRSDYAQLQTYLTKNRFVDRLALGNWLKSYNQKVISFVDFEWDTYGIPPYIGMKAFDVLPFQYSLHVLKNNELIHKEFLGEGDTRRHFIESLLRDMPEQGPIFAYNAFGAEVIRLKELAVQFPEYEEQISHLISRFVDLATLFISGVIYDEKMEGQFSLKQLIKVIDPSLTYENLAISHGMEAVAHYRTKQDEESDEIMREALLSYCRMDTYAMVKVFEWVKEIYQEV